MEDTIYTTAGEWGGRHFVFATPTRKLTAAEAGLVAQRWAGAHDEIAGVGQSLFVDLGDDLDRTWPDSGVAPFALPILPNSGFKLPENEAAGGSSSVGLPPPTGRPSRVGSGSFRSCASVFRLVYVSVESQPFGPDALRHLLAQCRERNRRLGITGMLVYRDGHFLQLLEGEAEAVLTIFDSIRADQRHCQVTTLLQEDGNTRLFSNWSMAFRSLDEAGPAFSPEFRLVPRNADQWRDPDRCLQLLKFASNAL